MVDALICLGGSTKSMEERVKKAVELYRQGLKLILTGGLEVDGVTEARFMRNIALKSGVLEEDIVLEEKARTTVENAVYCAEIMDKHKHNLKSALVITSSYHLSRASLIFNQFMRDKDLRFVKSEERLGLMELIFYSFLELLKLLWFEIRY